MTAKSGRNDGAINENFSRPYPPSWVNYLTGWVAGHRWPSGYFYLGLWLVLVSILITTLWIEGVYPLGTTFPVQFFLPAMIVLFPAVIHFLDNRSDLALSTLKPDLTITDEEFSQLGYRLTTMPAWPTILSGVVTIGIIYLLGAATGDSESSIDQLASSPMAANLVVLAYWIAWWIFGTFLYHTIHQLRVINRIYTEYTRINLFAMRPLYAFSSITASTAVTIVVATYSWTALNPDNLSDPVSIVIISLITVLAFVAFAWPLLGIHRILEKEKGKVLDECAERMEAAIADLHQRMDSGDLEGIEQLNLAMASLEIEHGALKRIPTWPWEPETVRLLITALALPLGLWIIQYILQLLLGS